MKKEINLDSIRYKTFEEFYNSVDEKGSLGLLALGAIGVLAWKKKKEEIKLKRNKESGNEKF